jgi:hypothetical protein
MDVSVDIFWTVILNDPINSWEIDTAGGYICAEEDRMFALCEFEIDGRTF